MSEYDINQQMAEKICNTLQLGEKQFNRGDWLALLDGEVVAVAPDIDGALSALRSLDADPHRGMVFEVGPPVVDVIR